MEWGGQLLEIVTCRNVWNVGKDTVEKGHFIWFVTQIRTVSSSWYRRWEHLGKGDLCSFIKGNICPWVKVQKGGLANSSCRFQFTSAQNNPYVKVDYFGVAYFDLPQPSASYSITSFFVLTAWAWTFSSGLWPHFTFSRNQSKLEWGVSSQARHIYWS